MQRTEQLVTWLKVAFIIHPRRERLSTLQAKLLRAQAKKQAESNLLGLHFTASGYEEADLCCWKWQENTRNWRQIPRSSSTAVCRISPLHFHSSRLQSRRSEVPPLPHSTETGEKSEDLPSEDGQVCSAWLRNAGREGRRSPAPLMQGINSTDLLPLQTCTAFN